MNRQRFQNISFNKIWNDLKRIRDHQDFYLFVKSIPNLSSFVNFIKRNGIYFYAFKEMLMSTQMDKYIPPIFLYECNLIHLFNLNEKFAMLTDSIGSCHQNIRVDRKKILRDSIDEFNRIHKPFHSISVEYKGENGFDGGGLKKDWFSQICESLKESNVFSPVPNGSSYIFNLNECNDSIIEFTGKFIALAMINRIPIPFKLTSSIFKYLLNEKVTTKDMNEYDSEIFQSLKWISENNPDPLMMTFVNSNDEPLCTNGENIKLNNENKFRYIKMIVNDVLLKKYLHPLRVLKNGFNKIINSRRVSLYLNSKDVRECIGSCDVIYIDDWKRNVIFSKYDSMKVESFFNVISKWPQEKIGKLLKFITGSSVVPIN